MYTDVVFKNGSLNTHFPEVTLYQDMGKPPLVAWKVIKHCYYQWTHPFRINWEYHYQFFDQYGNYSTVLSISDKDQQYQDIVISIEADKSAIHFKKTVASEITGVCLLKNHCMVAIQAFYLIDKIVTFNLSNKFMLCADLRVKQQEIINPLNINKSLTTMDITALSRLTILMLGGQPHVQSEALRFEISHPPLFVKLTKILSQKK